MAIPKVFISYSHDSLKHKKWVLELATRLRNNGIDSLLDQWELRPGEDIPHFMETHIKNSDYVLIVCTDRYVEKANAGKGGVGYEKMIITADLIKGIETNKFIPIIRQTGTHNVPTFIETKLFINLSLNSDFEFGCDELVRTIHDSPLYTKPKIGNNPFKQGKIIVPEKPQNALKELMNRLIKDYESGKNYSYLHHLRDSIGISRILFDLLIKEATDKGLIKDAYPINNSVKLTDKGKFYAVENNLIS